PAPAPRGPMRGSRIYAADQIGRLRGRNIARSRRRRLRCDTLATAGGRCAPTGRPHSGAHAAMPALDRTVMAQGTMAVTEDAGVQGPFGEESVGGSRPAGERMNTVHIPPWALELGKSRSGFSSLNPAST